MASNGANSMSTTARASHRVSALAASLCAGNMAPSISKLLVANRGEIAIRIFRAARDLGIATVAVYAEADAKSLHVSAADEAVLLRGDSAIGPYLDIDEVVRVAKSVGATAIHPGYGFLSENAAFVRACDAAGITFVGPPASAITLFGDKTAAKALAHDCGVPVALGSPGPLATAADAEAYVRTHAVPFPVLIKAVFGGGGRGQRVARSAAELAPAFEHCSKEAQMAFGDGACFVEEFVEEARHIEVQVLADGAGGYVHLYERDCSVQLRSQKVVEVAPARDICPALRKRLTDSALALAKASKYRSAGTVEFLVRGPLTEDSRFIFLEMNPRIQVEHTITEEVCAFDLVKAQLRIAGGATLAQQGVRSQADIREPVGFAMQLRIGLMPGPTGPITAYSPPSGRGIRVDSAIAKGSSPSTMYDPMVVKLIVWEAGTFEACAAKAAAALAAFRIEGIRTNADFVRRIISHPDFLGGKVFTSFVDANKDALVSAPSSKKGSAATAGPPPRAAGKKKKAAVAAASVTMEVSSPFPGQVVEIKVPAGGECKAGQTLLVVSAMKMLNEVPSPVTGVVKSVSATVDTQVNEGDVLAVVEGVVEEEDMDDEEEGAYRAAAAVDVHVGARASGAWYAEEATKAQRPSTHRLRSKVDVNSEVFSRRRAHNEKVLKTLHERLALVAEGGGGRYVDLHRKRGKLLPRERIARIIDPGTQFLELSALAAWGMYGGKIHSAAMVTGVGVVHGVECMFFANDPTVKGGVFWPETSKKQLRAQEIAEKNHLPCIYLVDGGGANLAASGGSSKNAVPMATFVEGGRQFKNQAVMSSKGIPQISAVLGKCTAGGAYIPAMSDESIIVKGNGTIYLGGPPLVKAATGEDADEQELGGAAMHTSKSGVADHFAQDEEEALRKTREVVEHLSRPPKHPLPTAPADPPHYPPDELLGIIPEDTNIPFDVREVVARVVDGSRFHEFKPRYGATLVCGFAHIHGYPVGILGNNGMLFSESAIKGAHFVQVCSQRSIPLVFLHNITGFIVGTQYEQGGISKDGAKMIMAVSCTQVPKFSVVLAGSHGAGNYAMCGPAFDPRFTFIWPNAKISVMGGQQAADVITIVKEAQLARDGKKLAPEVKAAMQKPVIETFEKNSSAYDSTRGVFDDGIIDPRDTRAVLGRAISTSLNAPIPRSSFGVFRM